MLEKFIDKSKTSVAVWIGINDINDSAELELDFPSFYDALIARMAEAVEKVYELGYGNFLFVNLPPLDRTPGNVVRVDSGQDARPNKTMVEWWNEALERQAVAFEHGHKGASVKLFDANALLNGVMDEPESCGIRNVTGYCGYLRRDTHSICCLLTSAGPAYNQPYINEDPASYGCLPLDEYL